MAAAQPQLAGVVEQLGDAQAGLHRQCGGLQGPVAQQPELVVHPKPQALGTAGHLHWQAGVLDRGELARAEHRVQPMHGLLPGHQQLPLLVQGQGQHGFVCGCLALPLGRQEQAVVVADQPRDVPIHNRPWRSRCRPVIQRLGRPG